MEGQKRKRKKERERERERGGVHSYHGAPQNLFLQSQHQQLRTVLIFKNVLSSLRILKAKLFTTKRAKCQNVRFTLFSEAGFCPKPWIFIHLNTEPGAVFCRNVYGIVFLSTFESRDPTRKTEPAKSEFMPGK